MTPQRKIVVELRALRAAAQDLLAWHSLTPQERRNRAGEFMAQSAILRDATASFKHDVERRREQRIAGSRRIIRPQPLPWDQIAERKVTEELAEAHARMRAERAGPH